MTDTVQALSKAKTRMEKILQSKQDEMDAISLTIRCIKRDLEDAENSGVLDNDETNVDEEA